MTNSNYKHARQMHAIAKTQLAQTGGVVFRQDDTITIYATLSDAVSDLGGQILRPSFYLRPNVNAALIYVTGSNTEVDAHFYDVQPFEYRRKRGLTRQLPLTPISAIEDELIALLDGTQSRQKTPRTDYGTHNSTNERGWFEKYQPPAAVEPSAKTPKPATQREGIERMFHGPQNFNN